MNLVVFENLFEKYRKPVLQSKLLMVMGKLQVEGEVIHVVVKECYDFSKLLRGLIVPQDETIAALTLTGAGKEGPKVKLPAARDFK